jgi:hypothetical protein
VRRGNEAPKDLGIRKNEILFPAKGVLTPALSGRPRRVHARRLRMIMGAPDARPAKRSTGPLERVVIGSATGLNIFAPAYCDHLTAHGAQLVR